MKFFVNLSEGIYLVNVDPQVYKYYSIFIKDTTSKTAVTAIISVGPLHIG